MINKINVGCYTVGPHLIKAVMSKTKYRSTYTVVNGNLAETSNRCEQTPINHQAKGHRCGS